MQNFGVSNKEVNFARFVTNAVLPIFQEKSWVLDRIQIRVDGQIRLESEHVWTWKFKNPQRKRCRFKNIRIHVDRA